MLDLSFLNIMPPHMSTAMSALPEYMTSADALKLLGKQQVRCYNELLHISNLTQLLPYHNINLFSIGNCW